MKKIWIALLMAFSIAFAGCKEEPVAPDPEIVTFDVLPGTSFTSGDIITVNFEARNSVSTENNIGAPTTTSWSYTTIATLNLNKITVTAVNLDGKKVTATKLLTVIAPYVPTVVDTICSKPIIHVSDSISFDNGVVWVNEEIAFGMKNSKTVFKKDFTLNCWEYPYGPENLVVVDAKWVLGENRTIDLGSGFKKFYITDATFTLFSKNAWIDDKGNEHPLLRKYCYTR